MRFLSLLIVLITISCDHSDVEKKASETSSEEEIFSNESSPKITEVERSKYIDERIASEVVLSSANATEPKENYYAELEGERYLIQKYQGTLMKASGHSEGFVLKFEPYDRYDYALETLVKSDFSEPINVILTKAQNDILGFVDFTDATNNLAWDYFENLFTIYYYSAGDNNYPLKFVDEGKTEWDG